MSSGDVFQRLRIAAVRIDQTLGRLEENRLLNGIDGAALDETAHKEEHKSEQWHHSRQAARQRLDTAIDRLEKILEQ